MADSEVASEVAGGQGGVGDGDEEGGGAKSSRFGLGRVGKEWRGWATDDEVADEVAGDQGGVGGGGGQGGRGR